MRDLTPIERAVVAMPWADQAARFVVLAAWDPTAVMQMVYNAVDWTVINEHVEQRA
jgi:hypothetical protein